MDPERKHVNVLFRWFGANFDTKKTENQEKIAQKHICPQNFYRFS